MRKSRENKQPTLTKHFKLFILYGTWTVKTTLQKYTELFPDLNSSCSKMPMKTTMNLQEPFIFGATSV